MAKRNITDLGVAPDGKVFQSIKIGLGGLSARILTFGAALQSLRLGGHYHSVVLGYADPTDYFDNPGYLGAIVGRYANRIADGRFTLEGRTHQLDRNEAGVQCLHGGSQGTGVRSWQVLDSGEDHVTLGLSLADGHMGFPGAIDLRCRYATRGSTLTILLTGRSDMPTYCNLASHAYYNLTGEDTIAAHKLGLTAEQYLPVDDRKIPLGHPEDVAGTSFDFLTPRRLSAPVDHNFCRARARTALGPAATLEAGGLRMTLETTEPGVQVYDGAALGRSGRRGLTGAPYAAHAGLALEPQAWPDAPNQPWAAQARLDPGETWRSETRLSFTRAD
ncbi:aldose epimerase family protein [Marinovum sp.]|uniref:aldose epimerase family protein n=1 Tax=Marinovum sp. TaxID=2024839 RepID=UPI002B278D72|nr:aldose epimerase family protein [Marinovum sp.]